MNVIAAGFLVDHAREIYIFVLFLILLFIIGVTSFFRGLSNVRLKRLIENVPTSNVSSAALGTNVEIYGAPVYDQIITAPISGQPCVFFSLLIQTSQVGSKLWNRVERKIVDQTSFAPYTQISDKTIVDQISSAPHFQISDGSGTVAQINPKDAEFISKRKFHVYEPIVFPNIFLPDSIEEALLKHQDQVKTRGPEKIQAGKVFLNHTFTEWYVSPEDTLYVLGFAATAEDGRTLLIQKRETGDFIISNYKENEMHNEDFNYTTILQIYGGALLAIFCSVLLYAIWPALP